MAWPGGAAAARGCTGLASGFVVVRAPTSCALLAPCNLAFFLHLALEPICVERAHILFAVACAFTQNPFLCTPVAGACLLVPPLAEHAPVQPDVSYLVSVLALQ